MSSYMVLARVSEALRDILWDAFSTDSVIAPIVGSKSAIVFSNPTETARDSANRLSLWLYQITENEFLKNQPPARSNGHTTLQETPLALNLYYLVTPFAPSGDADLLLLGLTMQVMYDNAIVRLQRPLENISEEIRVVLSRLSLEELTRVWEALREPYRLSVCYQVKVTRIASRRETQQARVIEANDDYGPAPVTVEEQAT
jgi:hypothetical protein